MKVKVELKKALSEEAIEGSIIEVSEEYAEELKSEGIAVDYVEVETSEAAQEEEAEAKSEEAVEVSEEVEAEVKNIEQEVAQEANETEIKNIMSIEVSEVKTSVARDIMDAMALAKARKTNVWTDEVRTIEQKAVQGNNETVEADGGALVSDQVSMEIFDMAIEASSLVGDVGKVPVGVGHDALRLKKNKATTGTPANYNGIELNVYAEGATIATSTPQYAKETAEVNKLAAITYITGELNQDVPALASYHNRLVGEAFGLKLEDEILYGTDSLVTPIVGHGSTASVNLVSGGDITADIINEMAATALNLGQSKWYVSGKTFYEELQGIEDSQGQRIVQPDLVEPYRYRMVGLPVEIVPAMQNNVNVGNCDLMLANLGAGYLMGTKGGVKFNSSIHVEFLTDQTAYRWVLRAAGQPTKFSPLTLADGRTVADNVTLVRSA